MVVGGGGGGKLLNEMRTRSNGADGIFLSLFYPAPNKIQSKCDLIQSLFSLFLVVHVITFDFL